MSKQGSNQRKLVYIAIILLAIVIVAAIAVSQMRGKPLATEFFTVTHTASIGEFSKDNRSVTIKILGLNISAIGGDATDVQLTMDAQSDPLNDFYMSIPRGTSQSAEIQLKGYFTTQNDNGSFPVEFDIACLEAQTSTFTLYISPQAIHRV